MAFHASCRIEIRPTKEQVDAMVKSCGVKRFVYNACLAKAKSDYAGGVKYSRKSMQKHVSELRKAHPWIGDVSSRCSYFAVDCLDDSFQRFFKKKSGFPVFKRKGVRDSFALEHSSYYGVDGRNLRLPKIGHVKMREKIRFNGRLMQVTIKPLAGKWFATFLLEMDTPPVKVQPARKPIVGVDFGIKTLAVLSTGQTFPAAKPLRRSLRKLKRRQRQMTRKVAGSNRRKVARSRVAKLHHRVQCQRVAALHNISNQLTKNFNHIVIEDLGVVGMMQNRRLAQALIDASFGELRRQIEYKAKWRGCVVTVADRNFASTKTCPSCGLKQNMPLSKREYVCQCGYSGDRDLAAAINLESYGRQRLEGDLKRTQESLRSGDNGVNDSTLKHGGMSGQPASY